MKKIKSYSILFVLQFLGLFPLYSKSVSSTPDLVILRSETTFKIASSSKAELEENYLLLIKNAEGLAKSESEFYYDNLIKISSLTIVIKDIRGEIQKKIHLSDFGDFSAIAGNGMYTEDRVKLYDFTQFTFPFFMEVSVERKYNGFLHLPSFYPIYTYGISAYELDYKIEYPKDYALTWKQFGTGIKSKIDTVSSTHVLQFHVDSIQQIVEEDYAPDFNELVPHVVFNLPYFKYDKTEGDLSSWTNYGNWLSALLNTLNSEFSDETKKELIAIKELQISKKEKAEMVYKWFQNKTRYISVQIGIGGYKPSAPKLVDAFGYGDCKALVYYYISLLKFIDIDAYYCVIKSSYESETVPVLEHPNFTYFNHVIAALPINGDTMFVECTNQKIPFGFVPSSWIGKPYLLVSNSQSYLSKVPHITYGENASNSYRNYKVSKDYKMLANEHNLYSGIQMRSKIWELIEPKEQLQKTMTLYQSSKNRKLENYEVELDKKYQFIQVKEAVSSVIKPKSDGRIILNVFEDKWMSGFDWDTSRLYTGVFRNSYIISDTIVFEFDTLIKDVILPENLNHSNKLYHYEVKLSFRDNKIWVYRRITINKVNLSLSEMKALVKENSEMLKYESSKIAFRF
ncbi:MAG: DUF3857 domain-containing protein [Bacteroidia bacterium]